MRISDWSSDVCSSDLFEMNRRNALMTLGVGVPALALAANAAAKTPVAADPRNPMLLACERPVDSDLAKRFPQVLVNDHNGEKFWFYENLIQDKLVLLSFASIDGEQAYPIIENIVKVDRKSTSMKSSQ